MTEKKQKARLPKGQAHIEYLAVKETIDELTASGYDLTKIYIRLKNEKRISMSYQAFYENRNRKGKKSRLRKASFEPVLFEVIDDPDKIRQRRLLDANTKASIARNEALVNQNTNQVLLNEEEEKRKDKII